VTVMVALVSPEREIWSGNAQMVIAKTLEGDIGILAGHESVLGVLTPGSVVRIVGAESGDITAAVSGGFLAVADDRVSVLARQAELGTEVDVQAVQSELHRLQAEPGTTDATAAEAEAGIEYARSLLRAAGQPD
jgi:F-type H+-transporting ATPase subunit epsilon